MEAVLDIHDAEPEKLPAKFFCRGHICRADQLQQATAGQVVRIIQHVQQAPRAAVPVLPVQARFRFLKIFLFDQGEKDADRPDS